MIKEIKIWWRLRPFIAELRKEVKELSMPTTLKGSVVFSIVLTVLQAVIQLSDMLPVKWRVVALVAQVVYEAVSKIRAFFFNPDGSAASLPYVKPSENAPKE